MFVNSRGGFDPRQIDRVQVGKTVVRILKLADGSKVAQNFARHGGWRDVTAEDARNLILAYGGRVTNLFARHPELFQMTD